MTVIGDSTVKGEEDGPDGRSRRRTVAVVVIHGIGEQRPMDTVRGFVESVLPDGGDGVKYFNKPDRMSESFELRKLQNRTQPRLHFFEYYWAFHVEGTAFRHVLSWARSLLFRRPSRVPAHLRDLWTITWVLLSLILVGVITGTFSQIKNDVTTALPWAGFAVAGLSALILAVLQGIVLFYVGDAARYLSPQAPNIALRRSIRQDGIALLRKLHSCKEYERIIVVGHSLGSVIAYDVLKHLWLEFNEEYATPSASDQPALSQLEATGHDLIQPGTKATVADYQNAQHELWKEMRGLGNGWLVTDLITLGSPLAHAALLLARDADDLAIRQLQRELPTCPPVEEVTHFKTKESEYHYSYKHWDKFPARPQPVTLRVLHHAAQFACTRWTNLYFPVRHALFGDVIAGAMQPIFGKGIADRAVTTSMWNGLAGHLPIAHNQYWRHVSSPKVPNSESIGVLKETIEDMVTL